MEPFGTQNESISTGTEGVEEMVAYLRIDSGINAGGVFSLASMIFFRGREDSRCFRLNNKIAFVSVVSSLLLAEIFGIWDNTQRISANDQSNFHPNWITTGYESAYLNVILNMPAMACEPVQYWLLEKEYGGDNGWPFYVTYFLASAGFSILTAAEVNSGAWSSRLPPVFSTVCALAAIVIHVLGSLRLRRYYKTRIAKPGGLKVETIKEYSDLCGLWASNFLLFFLCCSTIPLQFLAAASSDARDINFYFIYMKMAMSTVVVAWPIITYFLKFIVRRIVLGSHREVIQSRKTSRTSPVIAVAPFPALPVDRLQQVLPLPSFQPFPPLSPPTHVPTVSARVAFEVPGAPAPPDSAGEMNRRAEIHQQANEGPSDDDMEAGKPSNHDLAREFLTTLFMHFARNEGQQTRDSEVTADSFEDGSTTCVTSPRRLGAVESFRRSGGGSRRPAKGEFDLSTAVWI